MAQSDLSQLPEHQNYLISEQLLYRKHTFSFSMSSHLTAFQTAKKWHFS
jgi:hypothetical protein